MKIRRHARQRGQPCAASARPRTAFSSSFASAPRHRARGGAIAATVAACAGALTVPRAARFELSHDPRARRSHRPTRSPRGHDPSSTSAREPRWAQRARPSRGVRTATERLVENERNTRMAGDSPRAPRARRRARGIVGMAEIDRERTLNLDRIGDRRSVRRKRARRAEARMPPC